MANHELSRRQFLGRTISAAAAAAVGSYVIRSACAADPATASAPTTTTSYPRNDAAAEKLGWRLGVQAYTFNHFTFFEAIDKTATLGIKYIEAYPGQKLSKDKDGPAGGFDLSMKAETWKAVKAKLDSAGVKLVNFGVGGVSGRKTFDAAKALGFETLVTETKPTDELDKLCEEYKIALALHNHPNSWPPDEVLAACKDRSKWIGACADTGHWKRRKLVPLECLQKLSGRIICLHFKDLQAGHDVPWGSGDCDAKTLLAELARQKFTGVFSAEYEYNWDNSVPDLARCAKFFDEQAAELARARG